MLADRFDEAQDLVDAAIARCNGNGERFAITELMRIKAEILRRVDGDVGASEAILAEAVQLAHQQGAKAWALRTALDLADLQASSGRRDDVRATIESVRATFWAGGHNADLERAERLLTVGLH